MATAILAAAVTGMAAVGPAASVAPMMGLPVGLAVATLVETSSLVTPMVAMTHLFGSCATAALIGARGAGTVLSGSLQVEKLNEAEKMSG